MAATTGLTRLPITLLSLSLAFLSVIHAYVILVPEDQGNPVPYFVYAQDTDAAFQIFDIFLDDYYGGNSTLLYESATLRRNETWSGFLNNTYPEGSIYQIRLSQNGLQTTIGLSILFQMDASHGVFSYLSDLDQTSIIVTASAPPPSITSTRGVRLTTAPVAVSSSSAYPSYSSIPPVYSQLPSINSSQDSSGASEIHLPTVIGILCAALVLFLAVILAIRSRRRARFQKLKEKEKYPSPTSSAGTLTNQRYSTPSLAPTYETTYPKPRPAFPETNRDPFRSAEDDNLTVPPPSQSASQHRYRSVSFQPVLMTSSAAPGSVLQGRHTMEWNAQGAGRSSTKFEDGTSTTI